MMYPLLLARSFRSIAVSVLITWLFVACSGSESTQELDTSGAANELPYQELSLDDLQAFESPTVGNWNIVGNVNTNTEDQGSLITSSGSGILVNDNSEEFWESLNEDVDYERINLFTTLKHGDIDLELDVMMPARSNSGIYLQGRYEVQLLDSWGEAQPGFNDMGGIYQRWDPDRPEGNEGYEGKSPRINAAKASGLWQHYKIKFRAPTFSDSGEKLSNARFVEVWLNGVLIHEDVEVTGPTRAAAFEDEQPLGPIMLQGDHGSVAFKNIRYKTYGDDRLKFGALVVNRFESSGTNLSDPDTLTSLEETESTTLSSTVFSDEGEKGILEFKGNLIAPVAGEYLFGTQYMGGGGFLEINGQRIVIMAGENWPEKTGYGMTELKKGENAFRFVYHRAFDWIHGFKISVEGPEIEWQTFSTLNSDDEEDWEEEGSDNPLVIEVTGKPIMHRSFFMHNGTKRTHVLSVATPNHIHYAYDLERGSLLQTWDGGFLDVSKMWRGRGEPQLATPLGAPLLTFHGEPDFALLKGTDDPWPDSLVSGKSLEVVGYDLDVQGYPKLIHKAPGVTLHSTFEGKSSPRSLTRVISVDSEKTVWHKIGQGPIEKVADDRYIVNDKRYYLNLKEMGRSEVVLRNSGQQQELLLRIPSGSEKISYTFVW